MEEFPRPVRQTLMAQCVSQTACGNCGPCRLVISASNRVRRRKGKLEQVRRESAQLLPEPVQSEHVQLDQDVPERPGTRANKATWVDYAVSVGMDRAAAEELTKAELAEMS